MLEYWVFLQTIYKRGSKTAEKEFPFRTKTQLHKLLEEICEEGYFPPGHWFYGRMRNVRTLAQLENRDGCI